MFRLYWPKEDPPSVLEGSWWPPVIQKNRDRPSADLYFQKESPGKDKEVNWLRAPKWAAQPDHAPLRAEGRRGIPHRWSKQTGETGRRVVRPAAAAPLNTPLNMASGPQRSSPTNAK
jgi:hypothetical protein